MKSVGEYTKATRPYAAEVRLAKADLEVVEAYRLRFGGGTEAQATERYAREAVSEAVSGLRNAQREYLRSTGMNFDEIAGWMKLEEAGANLPV